VGAMDWACETAASIRIAGKTISRRKGIVGGFDFTSNGASEIYLD
jgi:hypothetical protein